jgi:methyl-accepting chemotaxis protein
MGKSYKRRKLFIKKYFQGRLILGCFLFVAGGGLLFNVLLGVLPTDASTISQASHDFPTDQTPLLLLKQILTANWFLIIIGSVFVMIASLFLSHRIAGPMFRFESTLENMKKGHLDNTIHLRDKDEGKELALKINELNSQLSQSFRAISQNSKALQILIEQSAELNLPEKEKEQLASLCWSMQEHNRKITNNCNYFSLKDE